MSFVKGSQEAIAWGKRMQSIRAAGAKTERKFFGKRGVFAKAGHTKHLKNPRGFTNIDRSGFKRGEYVGYADGVWRIYKDRSSGVWYGVKREGRGFISGSTLEELSIKLEQFAIKKNPGAAKSLRWFYSESMKAWHLSAGPGSNYFISPDGDVFRLGWVLQDKIQYSKTFPTLKAAMDHVDHGQGKKIKRNPGAAWHKGMEAAAARQGRQSKEPLEKALLKGMEVSHRDSASAARKLGMNPRRRHTPERIRRVRKNPIAVFGFANPPERVNTGVAGIIYNRCIEIRAEKTGYKHGLYKHPFSRASGVQILALDNGDLLIHSTRKVRLWKRS